MNRIIATFDVITPLFLGGADPAETAELRAPSIKGVLRFWWRALAWSRCNDLAKIHAEEQQVFGAAETGQSSFQLRTRWLQEASLLSNTRSLVSNRFGTSYLGYGVINRGKGQTPRPALDGDGRFEISLLSLNREAGTSKRHDIDRHLVDALKLFGLLGGLGGRARRGWGSVAMTSVAGAEWATPVDLGMYQTALASLVGSTFNAPQPAYSAFGKGTRLWVFGVKSDPIDVLNCIGMAYQEFRKKNRTFAFGLPHKRWTGKEDRRASPLLFHLHRLRNEYAAAVAFLRSPFLEGQPLDSDYDNIDKLFEQLPVMLKQKGLAQAAAVIP
ncbi:MAG TPA: type III-B CRISPR module RAMP protein Cmr1 [Rhizomicrobium sp.]|nr:type III-B CRISPR module RAMP protein Cmr1 [Rhizomicrobium sp.]